MRERGARTRESDKACAEGTEGWEGWRWRRDNGARVLREIGLLR